MLQHVSTTDRPFGLPALITTVIDVPCPPSVNRTRRSWGLGIRKLGAWHVAADAAVLATRRRRDKITGPFEATIVLSHTVRLDCDNAIKALLDYACRIELIVDDGPKYLRRLVVEWGEAPRGCRLTLRELTTPERELRRRVKVGETL